MHLIDYGGVRYIQIDTGRIGGFTSAWGVAHYALAQGVTYVNHTFTTPLALSASRQPFAGLADRTLCEYPVEPSLLAATLTEPALSPDQALAPDPGGQIHLPDTPGLGVTLNLDTIRKYLQPVEIRVAGRLLYQTPSI
jgi:L-alanine-DL-glutamate epimerase-like enolase superfamily enzyme